MIALYALLALVAVIPIHALIEWTICPDRNLIDRMGDEQ